MDSTILREGIFALNTRRFGSVAEVMIKRLVECGKAKNQFHDLYDDHEKKRIEVKFSRVLKAADTSVTVETILKCVEEATSIYRLVACDDWKKTKFDCNIQQIKRAEFDVLYYGLFFFDKIMIFKIHSQDIGASIFYSDRQHKGNVGEGQFHINQDTLQIHIDKFLYNELDYDQLLDLLLK
jgi:hypothetical protein